MRGMRDMLGFGFFVNGIALAVFALFQGEAGWVFAATGILAFALAWLIAPKGKK